MPDTDSLAQRTVLHVGCGSWRPGALHAAYEGEGWREIRLDFNPSTKPDIVASMTDMSAVSTDSVDAIWNSHALEHLYRHEVPVALREFFRVLRPGGHVLMRMPDLQKAAALIVEKGPLSTAYTSPSGPITPLDILYGHGASIARGETGMAHKTGFTMESLAHHLTNAGFANVKATQKGFDLWARGEKPDPTATA
ncbi:class I SAM-dependent methyltransferase [Pelagibius litoralis]|uniref:class I SAM-dependent methyltransferase n=1 Tax=Pelagibius litoralis TaxID=374515 RepID=UPI0019807373|nr:methyltransferase domain-containing protein [Pelagibius litoralis]